MTYTEDDIRKYQELCRRYFSEEVETGQAIEELNELVFMMSLMYHPELQDRIDVESSSMEVKSSRKVMGKSL